MLPRWVTPSCMRVRPSGPVPPPRVPTWLRGKGDAGPEVEFGHIIQQQQTAAFEADAEADALLLPPRRQHFLDGTALAIECDLDRRAARKVEAVAEVRRFEMIVLVRRRHARAVLGDDARGVALSADDDGELVHRSRKVPPARLLDENAP